jgi:hypothetical protein
MANINGELTYGELMVALNELTSCQRSLPVRIAVGRKLIPLYDTSLSCECKGGSKDLVGENYPILMGEYGPAYLTITPLDLLKVFGKLSQR